MSTHQEDSYDRFRLHLLLNRLLRDRVVSTREATAMRRLARLNRDLTGHWPNFEPMARQLRAVSVVQLELRSPRVR